MKKIVLDLDTLAVESFAPEAKKAEARGTVHGHATLRLCGNTFYCTAGHDTCQYESCVDTCAYGHPVSC